MIESGDYLKYILLSVAAVAIVFGLSFLLTGLIRKKQKKKLPLFLHILISVGLGLLIFCVVGFGYLNVHYTAQEEALAVLSDSGAAVTGSDGGDHAQFGNYGAQKGDGEATISAKEQQSKTAYAVLKFAETLSDR